MAAEEILRLPAGGIWTPEEERAFLRRTPSARALVFASWAALEPEEGRFDEGAFDALRERLMALLRLGAEPALCLYAGEDPAWFAARGGWAKEDNLRCYLRYAGRTVRAAGHLAGSFVTMYAPNALVWGTDGERGLGRGLRTLSYMACDHVRAVKLIRDTLQQRGLEAVPVGFVLRMAPALELRRGLLAGKSRVTASLYQKQPLLAMAKGEFIPPMRNILRVRPGGWCDFVGVDCPAEKRERVLAETAALTDAPLWIIRRPEEE